MPPSPAAESATRVRTSAWRTLLGALWVLGAAVCAVLSRGSLLASHPAYLVTLAAVCVVGLVLVGTGLRRVPSDRPRHRTATTMGRIGGGLATAVVLGAIGYLVPITAAPEAIAAMSGDATVRVESSPTRAAGSPPAYHGRPVVAGARSEGRMVLFAANLSDVAVTVTVTASDEPAWTVDVER